MNLPTLEQRIAYILKNANVGSRPCKACGTMLYWLLHNNGKQVPYTHEGVNHFIDCPRAPQFRKAAAPPAAEVEAGQPAELHPNGSALDSKL